MNHESIPPEPERRRVPRWRFFLFFALGLIVGAVAFFAVLIAPVHHPWNWKHMTLGVSDPDCAVVLRWQLQGFLPPSEYDRAVTVLLPEQGRRLQFAIHPDTGGMSHVPVYVVEASGTESGDASMLLFLVSDGAVLIDPVQRRLSEFQLARPDPREDDGLDLVASIASEDWGEAITLRGWRYVGSFDRGRHLGGWGVIRYAELEEPVVVQAD